MHTNHDSLYAKARLYDIAFSFKDCARENAFMHDLFTNVNGRRPLSMLELAAGPARNALMFAKNGGRAAALDLSPEMREYALGLSRADNIPLRYECADMRDFSLNARFDIACMLMESLGYLLTDEDALRHLCSVASHLEDGGVYYIEAAHPRDIFTSDRSTITEWTTADGDASIDLQWGAPDDSFDPIRQITQLTARLRRRPGPDSEEPCIEISEQAPQRSFGHLELRSLVARTGLFTWLGSYGDWRLDLPMDNSKASWRMIVALQKISAKDRLKIED